MFEFQFHKAANQLSENPPIICSLSLMQTPSKNESSTEFYPGTNDSQGFFLSLLLTPWTIDVQKLIFPFPHVPLQFQTPHLLSSNEQGSSS
jgi:hypothetical protein